MERREFGYLAALAVLPGCSSTAGDGTSEGEQGGDGGATVESGDVPGLGEDGIENVDAFLDAQRAAAEERSHAVSLTETAADTFEDGFKALELRAKYDPSTGRLHLRQWARYPDGDRSQQTEVYSDGSKAGERSILGEDDSRLERLSSSAARDRYTGFRESVRSLLAAVEYGPMEDVTADAGASYRLPITGVRDVGDESRVQDVGSGHLLLSGAGLVRAVELDALVYGANRERESNLAFEVTGVGETSVSEPDWFGDVPETTTTDGGGEGGDGGDGDSGTVETTETTTTTEQTPVQTIEGTDYDTKVVVGPDEELVFDPEVLRIEPGTTVRWVWESDSHNIKPEDQPAEGDWNGFTEIANAGAEYQYTFEVEGVYEYICQPHAALGMKAEIVVES